MRSHAKSMLPARPMGVSNITCPPEVTKLDNILVCEEHVARPDVPVQNALAVAVMHCKTCLGEPLQHLFLREKYALLRCNPLREISAISILHYDADNFGPFFHAEHRYHIRVLKASKKVKFCDGRSLSSAVISIEN